MAHQQEYCQELQIQHLTRRVGEDNEGDKFGMEIRYKRAVRLNWQAFKSANRLPLLAIDYIEKEWISCQIQFAHYSVNKYMHVDHLSS